MTIQRRDVLKGTLGTLGMMSTPVIPRYLYAMTTGSGGFRQFRTPADQAIRDFGSNPEGLARIEQTWSQAMNAWSDQAIVGKPWNQTNNEWNKYRPCVC